MALIDALHLGKVFCFFLRSGFPTIAGFRLQPDNGSVSSSMMVSIKTCPPVQLVELPVEVENLFMQRPFSSSMRSALASASCTPAKPAF